MEVGTHLLRNTAGRRAAVVEKGQEACQVKMAGKEKKKKKEKNLPVQNVLDNFEGESLPTTAEILSSTRLIETDTGRRLPAVSYRIPVRNFLSRTCGNENEILKGGIKIIFLYVLDQVIVVHNLICLKLSTLKESH